METTELLETRFSRINMVVLVFFLFYASCYFAVKITVKITAKKKSVVSLGVEPLFSGVLRSPFLHFQSKQKSEVAESGMGT